MMTNMPEVNSIGSAGGWGVPGASFGGGFGGGIGAFGLFGLIGLDGLRGRRGGEGDDCGCQKEIATLAAIASAKETTVAEGRGLLLAVGANREASAAQAYAAAIQAAANTQSVKDQATAFAIVNDKRFDDLQLAGVTQTAAILARINQSEIDSLRDQLHAAHRHADGQEVSINIQNSNAQLQAQLQAQAQVQTARDFDHIRRFDALFFQANKASQDTINFGTMAASANQANTQQNAKS